MNDRTLLKVAVFGSVIGIVILFFLSASFDVNDVMISEIDEIPEGKEVKVTGMVMSISDQENVMFVDIAEEKIEDVTIVLFKNSNVVLEKGNIVTITGSVDSYKGERQIIGNRVERKK
jgi:aspartyl/asparaginyl-tRNA synthetase